MWVYFAPKQPQARLWTKKLTVSTLSLSNFEGLQRDTAVGSAAQLPKEALASAVVAVPTVATKSVILISMLFGAFPKLGSSLEASPSAA